MKPLSPRARLLLDRHRAEQSLSSVDKNRLLAVIQERGARGELPRFEVQAPPPQVSDGPWVARLWRAPLGKLVVATAVAVPVVAAVSIRKTTELPAPAPSMAKGPDRVSVEVAEAAELSTADTGAAPPSSSRPRAIPKSTKGADGRQAPLDSAEPTIDVEMQLLNAAQASLRSGKPTEALRLLEDHATRFPSSKLSETRDVTRMTALCRLGQVAQATKEAERFLASHPDSPFADRVRRVCVKPGGATN